MLKVDSYMMQMHLFFSFETITEKCPQYASNTKDKEFFLKLNFSHFRQQPLELLFPQFVDRTLANIVRFLIIHAYCHNESLTRFAIWPLKRPNQPYLAVFETAF